MTRISCASSSRFPPAADQNADKGVRGRAESKSKCRVRTARCASALVALLLAGCGDHGRLAVADAIVMAPVLVLVPPVALARGLKALADMADHPAPVGDGASPPPAATKP